jgi:hypothetical protein
VDDRQTQRETQRHLHRFLRVGSLRDELAEGVQQGKVDLASALDLVIIADAYLGAKDAKLTSRERQLEES